MTSIHLRKQRGFSLLELAIALAILALITGGVLKGRELLKSARVQSTIEELTSLETAVSAFQTRYSALPGDFSGAKDANVGANNGDGNAQIAAGEITNVFEQLQRAGFIQGTFTPPTTASSTCATGSCMPSKLGGFYSISHSAKGPNTPNNALSIEIAQTASAQQLAELDRKMDDGNPNQGRVQALSTNPTGCSTTTAWTEATNGCGAVYFLN